MDEKKNRSKVLILGQPNQSELSQCVEQAVNKFDEQKAVLWVNLRNQFFWNTLLFHFFRKFSNCIMFNCW